jgi:hypothetical protein
VLLLSLCGSLFLRSLRFWYDSLIHKSLVLPFLLQFFLMNTHFDCIRTNCVLLLIIISVIEYPVHVRKLKLSRMHLFQTMGCSWLIRYKHLSDCL